MDMTFTKDMSDVPNLEYLNTMGNLVIRFKLAASLITMISTRPIKQYQKLGVADKLSWTCPIEDHSDANIDRQLLETKYSDN